MQNSKSFKDIIKSISYKVKNELFSFIKWIKNSFGKYNDTAALLFGIFLIFTLAIFFICQSRGGFFTLNTDDIAQYYPIMAGFIKDLKNGDLSLYNNSFFAGASYFANSYYVPLDIFTLLTYLFSFIMKTENAYGLVNLIKIGAGGMMMSLYLHNHGFKNKTVFLFSLIFAFGGLMTAECVFPVYWSLLFYIPLGLYVVDKFISNHYFFYLVPIYTFVIVLYDFYIAYMLLALLMIYLVMVKLYKGEGTFFGKKTIFKNKWLYIDIASTFGLILIGLLMSMAVFLPSYKYITDKTVRNAAKEVLSHYKLTHYVTILSTYFTTGNPISVLLNHGDYIRNHASMFMTLFGLMSLVLFFTLKGNKNRYLKIFIVISNIVLGIPLISMIMTGTNQAYIRWFFIVYFINFYGAASAFDLISEKKFDISLKLISSYVLIAGAAVILFLFFKNDTFKDDPHKGFLITTLVIYCISSLAILGLYIFFTRKIKSSILFSIFIGAFSYLIIYILCKDDSFKMYDNSDFFWPILIIFLAFTILYILALFLPKRKITIMTLALLEVFASMIMTFVNVGNTGTYYYFCQDEFNAFEINLKATTSYSKDNAYRVAIYTNESTYMTNLSFLYDKFNSTQFFHSFYDSTINDLYGNLYSDSDTKNWHRREIMSFVGPYALIDGTKYVVVPNYKNTPMPEFYHLKHDDTNYKYYEIEEMKPFIIYDKIGHKPSSYLKMANNLTQIGYFNDTFEDANSDKMKIFTDMIAKYNLKAASQNDYDSLTTVTSKSVYNGNIKDENGNQYVVLNWNIAIPANSDSIMITPTHQFDRLNALNDSFIVDTEGNKHQLFAGYTAYDHSYTPKQIWVKSTNNNTYILNASTFNFSEIFQGYLDSQSEYKNQYFSLDGSLMKIKVDYKNKDYNRILKTNFTYSDEWKVNNKAFETISIDGGYLGIILPSGTTSCDIELKFEPTGFNFGLTISGFVIGLFSTACVMVYLQKQRKDDLNRYLV